MPAIERKITVLEKTFTKPIHIVQNSNLQDIEISVEDWNIPSDSTVYWQVARDSNGELNVGRLNGNTIVIQPYTSTFQDIGETYLQIRIERESRVLVTFSITIYVEPDRVTGGTHEGYNSNVISTLVAQYVDESVGTVFEDLRTEAQTEIAVIRQTGQAVIESIPSDYTALSDIQISEAKVDSKVIIPCDDTYTMDYQGFTFKMGKMQFYLNGKPPYANTRINIYINGASASSNPTYSSKPAWYHDPFTQFVIGHRYKFKYYIIQGSQDKGTLEDTVDHSFVLRDKANNAVTVGAVADTIKGRIWTCTFVPEMICINLKQFTFDNAILYFEIIDLTSQEQEKAVGYQIPIFELKNKTYTIGHSSGGNASTSDPNIPENSIEGLVQYARQGYWGVSCDIQLTSDGEWILMHDIEDGIARTTTGTGMVKDLTLAQIKAFDMRKGAVVTSYKVPTVEEWMKVGRMYGMYLSLQIEEVDNVTDESIHDLIDIINKLDMRNQIILASFSVTHLQKVKAIDSRLFTCLLYRSWVGLNNNQLPTNIASLAKYGNVGVSVNISDTTVTEEKIREYQIRGVKVGAWTCYPSTKARTIEVLPWGWDFISAEVCPNVLDLLYTGIE